MPPWLGPHPVPDRASPTSPNTMLPPCSHRHSAMQLCPTQLVMRTTAGGTYALMPHTHSCHIASHADPYIHRPHSAAECLSKTDPWAQCLQNRTHLVLHQAPIGCSRSGQQLQELCMCHGLAEHTRVGELDGCVVLLLAEGVRAEGRRGELEMGGSGRRSSCISQLMRDGHC